MLCETNDKLDEDVTRARRETHISYIRLYSVTPVCHIKPCQQDSCARTECTRGGLHFSVIDELSAYAASEVMTQLHRWSFIWAAVRPMYECYFVCIFLRLFLGVSMIYAPTVNLEWWSPAPSNMHTHTHTLLFRGFPLTMTQWTGATPSLKVWLLCSPAEMDVTEPHHAGLISLFLEAGRANRPLALLNRIWTFSHWCLPPLQLTFWRWRCLLSTSLSCWKIPFAAGFPEYFFFFINMSLFPVSDMSVYNKIAQVHEFADTWNP